MREHALVPQDVEGLAHVLVILPSKMVRFIQCDSIFRNATIIEIKSNKPKMKETK